MDSGGRGGFVGLQVAGGGPEAARGGHASLIAIEFGGERRYVQLTAKSLIGLRHPTVQFLWRCRP